MSTEKIGNFNIVHLLAFMNEFDACFGDPDLDCDDVATAYKANIEKYGLSKANKGLQQAIKDVVEDLLDLDPDDVQEFQDKLNEKGIDISVQAVIKDYWKSFERIKKRGKLNNDEEYSIIMGILNDTDNNLEDGEIEQLNKMIIAYEEKHAS
ncbi:hypothetical protein [Hahella ganghwensis]|uniref:hypothetical protein n=1 Tax=Hahella ganghwensis TaxID=286420 RepID=UPI000372E4C7|nr:hypothetical protein [Hahella ganghwensis]